MQKLTFKNVKLIALDLDDTLYPEVDFVKSGFRAVALYIKRQFAVECDFYNILWDLFLAGERRETFNRALEIISLNSNQAVVGEMVKIYRQHKPSIELHTDAKDLLNSLKGKIKLGLITDGYLETQKNKVNALKIDKYFDLCLFTDAEGKKAWKPDQWGYKRMMERFSLKGENCIYVGDNSLKDFAGAKALGWKTYKIIRDEGLYRNSIAAPMHDADFCIQSLTELKALLAKKERTS